MTSAQPSDGSEDVGDFLRRIKELENKREHEDTERTRKLEEDIIQGRKQREARRAERARSVSPEKSSPAPNSPRSLNSPRSKQELPASPLSNISNPPAISNSIQSRLDTPPTEPTKPVQTNSSRPLSAATIEHQSSSLSWLQKPLQTETDPSSFQPSSLDPSNPDHEQTKPSRLQIAQSLASKDPAWFRQTQDGARGSAAFRRNIQDAELQQSQDPLKRQLAGMSTSNSASPDTTADTARAEPSLQPPATADKLLSTDVTPAISNSNDRSAQPPYDGQQARSPSPTKGMGGFVQSAMLKRSESVTKRWSAQPTLGLSSRGLATTTDNPSGAAESSALAVESPAIDITQKYGPKSLSTLNSGNSGNPVSSSQMPEPLITQGIASVSRPQTPTTSKDINQKPPAEFGTPSSPTKRWSPMKSTWLESALNKPEVTSPPKYTPSQPAWMSQLAKAKQERASKDLSNTTRDSPSLGVTKTLSSKTENMPDEGPLPQISSPPKSKPQTLTGGPVNKVENNQNIQPSTDSTPTKPEKPATPPKKDFKFQLKPSVPQTNPAASEEPEFLNAFGKLKRTQTEKYVAPDELKNNILRGKAGLSLTGGPQKSVRKDEFKESLIKQREDMKTKAQDGPAKSPLPTSPPVTAIPEAIAKKKALARNDSTRSPQPSPAKQPEPIDKPALRKQESPGPLQPKPAHVLNEVGTNFNANLANILSKGPRQNSHEGNPSLTTTETNVAEVTNTQSTDKSTTGQLQHVTKARARGPKRRLPNAGVSTIGTPSSDKTVNASPPKGDDDVNTQQETTDSQPTTHKARPTVPENKPRLVDLPKPSNPPQTSENGKKESKTIDLPATLAEQGDSTTFKRRSVKEATAIWGLPHGHVQLSPTKSPSNSPLVKQEFPDRSLQKPSQFSQEKEIRLPSPKVAALSENEENAVPLSPKPKPTASKVQSSGESSQPTPSSDAEKVILDFFGRIPTAPSKTDVDINSIVNSKLEGLSPIQTLRKQMREVISDGKLLPVSSQEEHVLISNRMYLCTHEFLESQKTRKTEVYLWIGAIVAEAAVEDAQLFVRKAAKEDGGTLITVRQGKEPTSLFQALGGILITRSGWTKDASSNYILCGRRHMGYLAFDEVPFSTSSLCSGFPYLIRASPDKVFLWKGLGCSTEELAAARLLSMDIGQMGEVQEIDEGNEPSEFFVMFPSTDRAVPKSAEHWKLKGTHERYGNRLFRVEHSERPLTRQDSGTKAIWNLVRRQSQPDLKSTKQTQISEISPFTKADLKGENIYVLDAFFDLYIILGSASNSKADAFAAALVFAQEYASISCSLEGRPHVPVATIVMEGVPKDMKRVFRRWDDDLSQTRNGPTESGLKRGKTLKILPLSKALAALGSK